MNVSSINITIQRFKDDTFFRNAVIFTSASLLTSVLNYAYYPIVARLIDVVQFGELQIAASFLLQLSTVFSGLNLISITLVNSNDESFGKKIIGALQKFVFWIFIAISIGLILISPILKDYFHFTSIWPFILIVPSLLISALSVFWTAYLQAKSDFKSLSIYSVTTGVGKIIFSIALILIGLGAGGGLLGIAIGLAVSLIIVRIVTSHKLPKLRDTLTYPTLSEIKLLKPHLLYVITVIVTLLVMSVLLSIDTFIVKRLFSAEFAGYYAGISTISRIIFFASAPIVAVMLPSIRLNSRKHNIKMLTHTIKISLVVCIGGLIIFSLFPEYITVLLLGESFRHVSHFLPALSLLATLATLTNIVLNYSLATKSRIAIGIITTSLTLSILLSSLFHSSIYEIILSICFALFAGQIVFIVHLIRNRRT